MPCRIREHRTLRLHEGSVKAAMARPTLFVKVAVEGKALIDSADARDSGTREWRGGKADAG
jgi:hypothetical protein